MHHWNSTLSLRRPPPSLPPSLPPYYLSPAIQSCLVIDWASPVSPQQRWVCSLPCGVTSSSCKQRNGWRVSGGYPPWESQTAASCEGRRITVVIQLLILKPTNIERFISSSSYCSLFGLDHGYNSVFLPLSCPCVLTWTSHWVLQWPTRSCRSCRSSCMSLCRGTQWRERCGTPPDRNQGRPRPDRSPLHLHWCAGGRKEKDGTYIGGIRKPLRKWKWKYIGLRLLPSWRSIRSTELPSSMGMKESGWSDCGLQSPWLGLHTLHT